MTRQSYLISKLSNFPALQSEELVDDSEVMIFIKRVCFHREQVVADGVVIVDLGTFPFLFLLLGALE